MLEVVKSARELLDTLTPINGDCGAYCNAACCKPDEDGQGGMFLFPDEVELYKNCDWAEIIESDWVAADKKVPILRCNGSCKRNERPLACRIFPLTLYFKANGELDVRLDRRAWAMCPLMQHGLGGLSTTFVKAVKNSLQLIAKTYEGMNFLKAWQALEDEYAKL